MRPSLSGDAALRHLGRTVGLLSQALAPVPPEDAPHNWRTAAHVHPDVPDAGELCRDLRTAGVDPELTRLPETRAARGRRPAGDRLDGPTWRQQVAAVADGYASAQEMTGAEAAAVPGLLSEGLVASVLWLAGRWRRGQARLAEVTDRLGTLERTGAWLAARGGELADLLAGLRSRRSA